VCPSRATPAWQAVAVRWIAGWPAALPEKTLHGTGLWAPGNRRACSSDLPTWALLAQLLYSFHSTFCYRQNQESLDSAGNPAPGDPAQTELEVGAANAFVCHERSQSASTMTLAIEFAIPTGAPQAASLAST
jgi:hypothetical protein